MVNQNEGKLEDFNKGKEISLEKKGKILIVEDNLEYASNAHEAVKDRGYIPEHSFDLVGALARLKRNRYSGVLTDINIPVEISKNLLIRESWKKEEKDEMANKDAEEVYLYSLQRDDYLYRLQRDEQEDVLKKAKKNGLYDIFIKTLRGEYSNSLILKGITFDINSLFYDIPNVKIDELSGKMLKASGKEGYWEESCLKQRQGYDKAYGIFIINECQNLETRVVPVTGGVSHGQALLPLLVDTGLTSSEELASHFAIISTKRLGCELKFYNLCGDYRNINIERALERLGISEAEFFKTYLKSIPKPYMSLNEESFKEKIEADEGISKDGRKVRFFYYGHYLPHVLDNLIIHWNYPGYKSEASYHLAVDILEGKIEKTRPYDLVVNKRK